MRDVDDELLSRDDRLVRDMVQKLKQKFLVKKVDYMSKVGDKIQILGRTVERTSLRYIITTSRRYIDQSLKDMDMETCNPVSTPSLHVAENDLATEEQLPEVLAGLYRRVTGRLLCVAGQRHDVQQAVKELARGMSSHKHSLGTAETSHAIPGEQANKHLEVRTNSQRSSKQ